MRAPRVQLTARKTLIAVAVVGGCLALWRHDWHGPDHSRLDPGDEVVVLGDCLFVEGWTDQRQQIMIRPETRAVVVQDDWDKPHAETGRLRPIVVRLLRGKENGT